ncbi:YqiA/YcfP family alpha/beta fold hydrolase [Amnimonas aquatica]|uniref:Alpha/beta hydrolase n=1 Tax=Amnimonas aquatica TaxID=2094561 RepID=A0A2P6ART0_9GAMM|nr:YqiA/YcfP family alpha/beta fold hydrolase [Amnimonas aquatica]PQA38552.1 alpha/beta hydrolase [Amnimonas aquatica]
MTAVHFIHGKESGPDGLKIQAMRAVAAELGLPAFALDYRASPDPEQRAATLLAALTPGEPVVLVGSSLGGFVAARAAEMAAALPATEAPRITGLFLLCPAFDLPGYPLDRPEQPLRGSAVQLVHGRHDDIVPLETSLRAGADWRGTVTVVEDDHPLHASVAVICNQLRHFLNSLCAD